MADRSRSFVSHPCGVLPAAALALAVAIVTGCVAPAGAPATAQPTAEAPVAVPVPATGAPTTAPADVGAGCPVPDQTFVPPSDQLVSLDVATAGGVDRITFAF